ncbi:16S rRNA (guanine(527)-N(7))-methyltransferase RsmG [Paraburkholderia bonniea]|uniref:16S rRNA (guanine(527)-N(7))-methyltransferase RsmG n=1 Tax=Paraburkholderia bonniea TaxID=2152891 RepID=UPI0025728E84|nr:16S rRNA (guanine(527)-N(7))-methyltransferase RsmG [Paraburkholderia bonniea]WJF90348.1 16S rRNA (guanine(527)-N(7))-methyltransferase RsmG [Paraburkholderia bonniea]WJF93663.1 16S rRNA (guanine(527)-N(7))-methyltransferase RsmG [Paraburkholderia bonniea]
MTMGGKRVDASTSRDAQKLLLDEGISELNLDLDESQRGKLLDYVALLAKWNAVYNLTAIRDPQQMLIQHILDSLSIVSHLAGRGPSVALDVGSGGGLPGIVLAVALPDWHVTLNDIVHKKTAFQAQAKAELGLSNLSVVTGRVETLRPGTEVPAKFDVIVSRAFAELADFVTLARHLVAGQGAIWAMKGVRPDDEIARLPAGSHATQVIRLKVPLLEAERHLVEVVVNESAQVD